MPLVNSWVMSTWESLHEDLSAVHAITLVVLFSCTSKWNMSTWECLNKDLCAVYAVTLVVCWTASPLWSCQHKSVCIKLRAVPAVTLVVCWTAPPCWSCQRWSCQHESVCTKLCCACTYLSGLLNCTSTWVLSTHGSCQHMGHVNMRESAWRSVCCACNYLSGAVQLHLHAGHVHVNVSEGHRTSQLHAACREQLLQHSKQSTVSRSIWEHACMCVIYTKSTFNWLLTLSQPLKCHLMWSVNLSPSAYRMVINFLLEFQHLMNSHTQQSYEKQ